MNTLPPLEFTPDVPVPEVSEREMMPMERKQFCFRPLGGLFEDKSHRAPAMTLDQLNGIEWKRGVAGMDDMSVYCSPRQGVRHGTK